MFSRLKGALGVDDKGLRATVKDALAGRLAGKAPEPAKPVAAPPPPPAPVVAKPVAAPAPAPAPAPVVATPAPAPVVAEPEPAKPAEAFAAEPPAPEAALGGAEPEAEAANAAHLGRVTAPEPQAAAPSPAKRPAGEAKPTAGVPLSLAAAAAAAAKSPDKLLHADTGSTDLEHYVARAKANNRDVGAIRGGVGLNRAEDGTPYWGPVDNESSRAKAAGHLLAIDQWECISCGTCVEQTDKVFVLPPDGKASPIAQDGPMDLIQDALEACPVTCIHWVPEEEAAERGLATGTEVG